MDLPVASGTYRRPASCRASFSRPQITKQICWGILTSVLSTSAAEPDDRQNRGSLDTPTGYIKRASDRRFRWSEALSRTRWQVKDSNIQAFAMDLQSLGGNPVTSGNA